MVDSLTHEAVPDNQTVMNCRETTETIEENNILHNIIYEFQIQSRVLLSIYRKRYVCSMSPLKNKQSREPV